MDRSRYAEARRAFTLVEVLIVVVILGILAAVVVPSFANATEPTRQTTFITNMKDFAESLQVYKIRNNEYPADTAAGEFPEGFDEYVDPRDWVGETPIGGSWVTEDTDAGYGVGVHFDGTGETRDEDYMLVIDEIFDDANLESGNFRTAGEGRYYLLLAN